MSHFAKINNNNIVTEIISSEKNFINTGLVGDEFLWIQTSYNSNFRKNFAGIGDSYDSIRDAFIPPKPYDSWVLDEVSCSWVAPVDRPQPTRASDGLKLTWHKWDEATTNWIEVTGET
jgi:hypothetical protein